METLHQEEKKTRKWRENSDQWWCALALAQLEKVPTFSDSYIQGCKVDCLHTSQACRQGGSLLNCTLSALPFENGSLVSQIIIVKMSLVAAMLFVYGLPAGHMHKLFSPLQWKDTHKYMCINKSLFQALESLPAVFQVMPPHLHSVNHGNSKLAGFAHAYMDNQKLDAILCKLCSYNGSASDPSWPQS